MVSLKTLKNKNFSFVTRREVYQLEFSNVWDIKSRKNLKELFNFFSNVFSIDNCFFGKLRGVQNNLRSNGVYFYF